MVSHSSRRESKHTFGAILRRHRLAQKLSLRELEARSSVSASFISRLERDEASATYDVIRKLASALGIDPAEFFRDNTEFRPSLRAELAPILQSEPVREMLSDLAELDSHARHAVVLGTRHWIQIIRLGLRPIPENPGTYRIDTAFLENAGNAGS